MEVLLVETKMISKMLPTETKRETDSAFVTLKTREKGILDEQRKASAKNGTVSKSTPTLTKIEKS